MVNSIPRYRIGEDRIKVMESSALREGAVEAVEADGWPVLLARAEGVVHAVINRCSHAAAAFSPGGRIRRDVLMCPAHGARFNIADGTCIGGLYRPLRTFPCHEADGWIEVTVPETAPGPDERPVTR